ncbi:MAG: alpha-amylase family glycosyl hydrolase [Chloroflexota bacterium]
MTNPDLRRNPHLYEVNACIFINRMSRKYRQTLTLMTVPDEEWQMVIRQGFDLVWLMGVWQRSSDSRQEALRHPELRLEFDRALPGWTDEDVSGSPYAIHAYELNPLLGQKTELAQLKSKLNRLGLRLILDFVPNHLACDHPWVSSHPGRFIQGKGTDLQIHPDWFFSHDGSTYLAHGKDPNFPPWTDTVQVNFYSPDLRQALIDELKRIKDIADGVRCDMAMLALNDVFGRVWGKFTDYPRPETEFWTEAIGQVKQERPDFIFLAEAYWDLERQLQQLGFDFTYDKTLYDRLRYANNGDVRNHLMADKPYQRHSVHFIENHDEQRAVTAFGRERSLAAAVAVSTVPGLRLFHAGQLEGNHTRLPVQLIRGPEEAIDIDVWRFYERLLAACNSPVFHDGEWGLLDFNRDGQDSVNHLNVLAWYWQYKEQVKIVVVNYSEKPSQGWLRLPLGFESTQKVSLPDELLVQLRNIPQNTQRAGDSTLNSNPGSPKFWT